ncbi:MAG: enterochelin esterase [Xanthomonadales bacterium]|nr:enterochelin esterase [Xanthomonadales bacterium]
MQRLRPQGDWPRGTVIRLPHRSRALENNPWDDPVERELAVYLPPGYSESGTPYIALWDLAAFTNSGPGHLNWRNQGENLPQRLDRLIGEGSMAPVVVAIPDCYTSLGGNQYVNSVSVGAYSDYLNDELVPLLGEQVNVVAERRGRGVFGKSSGGYGALYQAMTRPDTWGAAASHAGDMGFELLFRGEFPTACSVLAPFEGDHLSFIRAFWGKNRPSGRDFTALMVLAMAASYDADPDRPDRIRLPFDLHTCELDAARWQAWLAWDPLALLEEHADALAGLSGLYIDVGMYDQYHIQYGARRFSRALEERGIPHTYAEFEGTHSAIDWRLDRSLPFLADALKSAREETI